MNKRGEVDATGGQDIVAGNVIYFISWLAVFAITAVFILGFARGEALQESFYAQHIAQEINSAPVGTNVTMDISPLVALAYKHGRPVNQTVLIDAENNKITVSTRQGASTSYYYFRDVDVENLKTHELSKADGTSVLTFTLASRVGAK